MAPLNESGLILDGIFYSVPGLRILQGIYLKVKPGAICALFGRNGCGKTTLMKVAAGQIRPNSGLVIIDGKRFYKRSLSQRYNHIAYLSQESMLPANKTVDSLINVFVKARYLKEDSILSPLLHERFENLSGGERRYLEVQLLLSLQRPYVLLDEPFTGIEPLIIDRISELLREAASQGRGILITDHYHQYILPLANQAYIMERKQCRRLELEAGIEAELQTYGYL